MPQTLEKEEDFLFKFWYLINPLMQEKVQRNIVLDLLKLLYDPYHETNNFDLVIEYIKELNSLVKIEKDEAEIKDIVLCI